MQISKITEIEQVFVFKKNSLAGILKRTTTGSSFRYLESYLEKKEAEDIAFSMPLRPEPYISIGASLNPFFAGMLPEGMRLSALVSALKTSTDDMFSILVAAGENLIGDISISLEESRPSKESIKAQKLEEISFEDLFHKSVWEKNYHKKNLDFSIAGVQQKISSQMISFPLEIESKKKSYILKLQSKEFPSLVRNENFFMELAASSGIEVPKTKIVFDKNKEPGLLVERFDRTWNKKVKAINKLHQEDACQFLERYPADKYRLSLREIASGIKEFSSAPQIENAKLLKIIIYSYLIYNGDLHGKNISLQIAEDKRIRLSPAYDLLSTLPYGDEYLALSFEGKKKSLTRKQFSTWANRFEINQKVVDRIIEEVVNSIDKQLDDLDKIELSKKKTNYLKQSISSRISKL